jgi:GTP-binding protein
MKNYKKIVIIGFPNVGKSTLFNRLLKTKKSLVHDLPGMTRDRISSICDLDGKKFLLFDTGGMFDSAEDPFSTMVMEKAWEASNEADILLFLLDGKRDLLPAEEDLYLSLKKLDKPIFVIVNKIDSEYEQDMAADYFRLGEEKVFFISAEHKKNIDQLKNAITEMLPDHSENGSEANALKIATAGIRKLSKARDKMEKAGIIKAKKDIMQADVVCLILDAQEFPTRQDTAIAHIAEDSGKPLMIFLNKWDLINKETKTTNEFIQKVYDKMDFISYAPVMFVSALSGQRIVRILETANKVYQSGQKKITTSKLNEFLKRIQKTHPPVSRKKGRIKIKYMTQTGVLPPTFTLFTHSQVSLAPAYEKYFKSNLRETFDYQGTPIRIRLRNN